MIVKKHTEGDSLLLLIGVVAKSILLTLKSDQFSSLFNLGVEYSPWLDRDKLVLTGIDDFFPPDITKVMMAEITNDEVLSPLLPNFELHANAIEEANSKK